MLRGDSTFAREQLMAWCEDNRVDFVFGLARNARLEKRIADATDEARRIGQETGIPARVFRDFLWSTKDSWSRRRRVIAQAEWTGGKANPRFVVTSLKPDRWPVRALYKDLYCACGDMENRIKECQLDLYADRASCPHLTEESVLGFPTSSAFASLAHAHRNIDHNRLLRPPSS